MTKFELPQMSGDNQERPMTKNFRCKSNQRNSSNNKIKAVPARCEVIMGSHAKHFQTRFNREERHESISLPGNT